LRFSALSDSCVVAHAESKLLGVGLDGAISPWPVIPEIPVAPPHTQIDSKATPGKVAMSVFASGARDDSTVFRKAIIIRVEADHGVAYAHACGLPGGSFESRSLCCMAPPTRAFSL
jgi:hypothetical protein